MKMDVRFWPVADLRDERADVRFVGWSGLAPDGLARSLFESGFALENFIASPQ